VPPRPAHAHFQQQRLAVRPAALLDVQVHGLLRYPFGARTLRPVPVLAPLGAVLALAAPAPAPAPRAPDARAAARSAYVAWVRGMRTRPAATCARRLTPAARRQFDAVVGDAGGTTRAPAPAAAPADPFVVRVRVAGRASAAVRYAPVMAHPMCADDDVERVLTRTDRMRRTRGGWRIARFGFFATECVPRSRFGRALR